ncbi:hypothetical protein QJQ45_021420 [Haematococcus lacustris]|nr:hypothetical protein QJQ45_021420 [Haematococcus lacustris]
MGSVRQNLNFPQGVSQLTAAHFTCLTALYDLPLPCYASTPLVLGSCALETADSYADPGEVCAMRKQGAKPARTAAWSAAWIWWERHMVPPALRPVVARGTTDPALQQYKCDRLSLVNPQVYQSEDGLLMQVSAAVRRGRAMKCSSCSRRGATVGCRVDSCPCCYHLPCAVATRCLFNPQTWAVACPRHRGRFKQEALALQQQQQQQQQGGQGLLSPGERPLQ